MISVNQACCPDGDFCNSDIYRQIVQSFFGAITVTQRDGTIIYGQNLPNSPKLPTIEHYIGSSMQQLVSAHVFPESPSLRTLQSGNVEISMLGAGGRYPVVTFSLPIRGSDGEVETSVAFSLPEEFVTRLWDTIIKSRETQQDMSLVYAEQENFRLLAKDRHVCSILHTLERVAASDATILFTGESGTGKEVFSRYVHTFSRRNTKPFIPVNCAAIAENLVESEFFGYEAGAFTGASRTGKEGLFEQANNGTLFLDEVGELPLSMQPKLLRAIESGEFHRVGGNALHKVDVRIIAATNRDLRQMVEEGLFREDLYYRLDVVPVRIPPLRERVNDILPLANYFLAELNRKYGVTKVFSQQVVDYFLRYQWPGNVRELRNVVERLFVTTAADLLELDHMQMLSAPCSEQNAQPQVRQTIEPLRKVVADFEQAYIQHALELSGGKVAVAAEQLEITKAGLYKKLSLYKERMQDNDPTPTERG